MAELTLELTGLNKGSEIYRATYRGLQYTASRTNDLLGFVNWELEPIDHKTSFIHVYVCDYRLPRNDHDLNLFEQTRDALNITWDVTNMKWERKMMVEGALADVFSGIWVNHLPIEVCHVSHGIGGEYLAEAWGYAHGHAELLELHPLSDHIAEILFDKRDAIRREIILRREGNMQIAVGMVREFVAANGQIINDTLGTIAGHYWDAFSAMTSPQETANHMLIGPIKK